MSLERSERRIELIYFIFSIKMLNERQPKVGSKEVRPLGLTDITYIGFADVCY